MVDCLSCQTLFFPRQTFADLFRLDKVCPRCRRLQNLPLHREVLPLFGKECHLYSFHQDDHPVFRARVFALMAREKTQIVFVEKGLLKDGVALAHLAALFTPVSLYRAEFFTMDEIGTLLEGLDSAPTNF